MAYSDDPRPVHCATCGREAAPSGGSCEHCGAAENIPNYLILAILATIGCLPIGIVAIVYAAQVNGRVKVGDYAEARRLSHIARTWCWVAFGVALSAAIVGGVSLIAGEFHRFLGPS